MVRTDAALLSTWCAVSECLLLPPLLVHQVHIHLYSHILELLIVLNKVKC